MLATFQGKTLQQNMGQGTVVAQYILWIRFKMPSVKHKSGDVQLVISLNYHSKNNSNLKPQF
jgi:hypothetical protein